MSIAVLSIAPSASLAPDRLDRAGVAARPTMDIGAVANGQPPASAPPALEAPVVRVPAPSRGGLSAWNPQLHGQLADAQQALSFLDGAESQLQGLKTAMSARLAGNAVRDEQITGGLRRFAATWSRRAQDAGRNLSARLTYEQPALQRFTVRGLNLDRLRHGDRETLSLSDGAGRTPMTVQLEPGLTDDEIVQRFARALAPARIGVSEGEGGALMLSTPESAWPAVRDALSIRGGGIRFAAGQGVRVRADAEPAAVQPENWQVGDVAQSRRTLQQVMQALELVRTARDTASRAFDALSAGVHDPPASADAASAPALVDSVVAAIGRPGFASFSPVTAASSGISRDRVLSLLALGAS